MNEIELLRRLRDADARPPDPGVRAAARQRLRDHARGVPDRRGRPRWVALAAPALAAAAAIAVILVTGLNGGHVQTPAASAREAVERAAKAAETGSDVPALAAGQFLYLRERDAYTATAADAKPGAFSVIVPELRETWIARDGHGQIVTRSSGKLVFPGPRDRRRWEAAGRPDMTGQPGRPDVTNIGADGFSAGSHTLTYRQLAALPSDGEAMYRRLIELAGDAGPSPDAEAFTIIGDLLRSAPVPPRVRAGLYRSAAHIKGVRFAGEVVDPLGRKGLALDLGNDIGRNRLIFDPETSQVLAEETVLTKRVGDMDARPGSVVGSRTVLRMAVVDRAGARPAK